MNNIVLKDKLDIANSLSWFFMDAAWMCGYIEVAYVIAPVVVVSGLLLCGIDRRVSSVAVNLGVLFWILMNLTWMLSEGFYRDVNLRISKSFFLLGLLCILIAAVFSENLRETFARFKRPRFIKLPR